MDSRRHVNIQSQVGGTCNCRCYANHLFELNHADKIASRIIGGRHLLRPPEIVAQRRLDAVLLGRDWIAVPQRRRGIEVHEFGESNDGILQVMFLENVKICHELIVEFRRVAVIWIPLTSYIQRSLIAPETGHILPRHLEFAGLQRPVHRDMHRDKLLTTKVSGSGLNPDNEVAFDFLWPFPPMP